MYSYMLTYITAGIGFFSIFSSLLTPFLFLLRSIGIKYYIIRNDQEKTRAAIKILNKTTLSSTTMFQSGNLYPSGVFIGYTCAGYYQYPNSTFTGESAELHILTTEPHFHTLLETENVRTPFSDKSTPIEDIPPLSIYTRVGSYTNIYYSRLRLDVQGLEPKGKQIEIVDAICSAFKQKRRGAFFIYGISGAGKSTIGLLVAKKLKGTFCHTFNPIDPGDTLENLLRESEPTAESPTVVTMEEINSLIRNVHEGTIQKHKNITTSIHNKSTYNTFMDDLILYKNVIIIMTSNENKDAIDALDTCYLRKGRIDFNYAMMEALDS